MLFQFLFTVKIQIGIIDIDLRLDKAETVDLFDRADRKRSLQEKLSFKCPDIEEIIGVEY